MNKAGTPTATTYHELQQAYDWFNVDLFARQLPVCLITLQRKASTMGYFSARRFVSLAGDYTDEIAMNPEYFAARSIEDMLSTLVHEMVHLWQQHFGQPGRGRYHNKQWAHKMEELGLCPSSTGQPGGMQTGDCMSHYIAERGRFAQSCAKLVGEAFRISWYDRFCVRMNGAVLSNGTSSEPAIDTIGSNAFNLDAENNTHRSKFRCPDCQAQAWGKPSLNLICADCSVHMPAVG